MDAQTLSLILGVAASKGDNVVASTRAAKASAQAAADARDKVTAAELGEAYSYLGLGELTKEQGQASGSIATFWTDMAARLISCKVSMNPVQDLHGYDSPWPAGGGKNLLNPASASELGKTVWFCEPDGFLFKAGVTYTLSVSDVSGISSISIYGTDKSTRLAYASGNNMSGGAHFTPEVDTYALPRLYSGTFVTQTMIDSTMLEIGATKTSFAPYSNICPITGWTGVNVTRTGKNLFDKTQITSSASVEVSQIADGFICKALSAGTYRIAKSYSIDTGDISGRTVYCKGIITNSGANIGFLMVRFYDANNSEINNNIRIRLYENTPQDNIIAPNGTVRIEVLAYVTGGSASAAKDETTTFQNVIISYEDVPYSQYTGDTYAVTIPNDPGTVYGGTLDVVTGEMIVNWVTIASYDGETLPGEWISDRDVYEAGATPTTGAQVVYELATPLTYTLTPVEIQTLIGQNNVWSDAGNVALTYWKWKE